MRSTGRIAGRGPDLTDDSVVVLFKGGRLPSWHRLSPQEQQDHSQEHVNLMLSVCRQYRLMHLEGFRLLGPQNHWQRFWIIEFPSLAGAEAWIKAEMAPPYGRYGYYEYHLARRTRQNDFGGWVTNPPPRIPPPPGADPHQIPVLQVDNGSAIVLTFRRWLPGAADLSGQERGEEEHARRLKNVARRHGLIRLEAFHLMAPQWDWHEAWVIELPTLADAEAWLEAETSLPDSSFTLLTTHLARKWAPAYFAQWVPPRSSEIFSGGQ